jgi:hypothetical protein
MGTTEENGVFIPAKITFLSHFSHDFPFSLLFFYFSYSFISLFQASVVSLQVPESIELLEIPNVGG